jgi:hypothetical protein
MAQPQARWRRSRTIATVPEPEVNAIAVYIAARMGQRGRA